MMRAVTDILNLYLAMLVHYFLKWPYVLKVFICVGLIFLLAFAAVKIIIYVVKRWGKTFIFTVLKYAILLFQLLFLGIVKILPQFRERFEKIDTALNELGIKLSECEKQEKSINLKLWKKIWKTCFWVLILGTLVFVVLPYYMEPALSGNAKDICAQINQMSAGVQERIQGYADKYYVPAVKEETEAADMEEPELEIEENIQYVLHLKEDGFDGANLRSTPEKKSGNVIIVIFGDDELIYENEIVDNGGIIWLKVSKEGIEEAWISKKLIREEDLEAAGIQ